MSQASTFMMGAASWWARWTTPEHLPVTLLVVALVLVVLGLLSARASRTRRRLHDIRRIVAAIEDVRSGRHPTPEDDDAGSPLALVFDAVHRLADDVGVRTSQVRDERVRGEAWSEVLEQTAALITDTDGDVRTMSVGATRLLGWREDELRSRTVADLFAPEAYRDFLPRLAGRELREGGVRARSRLLRREGAPFAADISVRLIRSGQSDATGLLWTLRDVTEQERLEERLRESEQRYRGLVEGLADGVTIVRDGRLLYVNPAFAGLCEVAASSLVGSWLRERVATHDLMLVEERLDALQSKPGAVDELVCRMGGAEGGWRNVRVRATAIDYDGAPSVLLLVRDESLDRRVEAELRRNEAQLDAVLEAASDGILVLVGSSSGSRVQMTNRAFLERFAVEARDILGRGEQELLRLLRKRGDGATAIAGFIASAGERRTTERFAEAGTEIEVEVTPLRGASRDGAGRVVAFRDLTEQREAERKLQLHAEQLQLGKVRLEQANRRLDQVNRDLAARGEQLDHLNRELRKLDEMKTNLLSNVSHDLQTPLVAIRGYTEMILKERLGPVTEEQGKGLKLSLENIDRLISMIDNLLSFARAGSELGSLSLSRFALRTLVDEVADLLEEKVAARELRLSVEVPDELEVHADRDKIRQVFMNLVANAIKFNRPKGSISISAKAGDGDLVQVEVADSGVGIPDDALPHVFDRHYQVRREGEPPIEGSGIGLAIVHDILRAHGCRIDVESQLGVGASFRFTLPRSQDERRADRPQEPSPCPPPGPVDPTPAHGTPDGETMPEGDTTPDGGATPGVRRRPRFRIIRRS